MKISIVVASSLNGCIGVNNTLPWSLPRDMKHFKEITNSGENNIVIMGRKTFESIGKPLPNRINYVLTTDKTAKKKFDEIIFSSLEDALENILWSEAFGEIEYNVCIIGGSGVFQEAINKNMINVIHHTLIHENFDGDTFLELPDWTISNEETFAPDEKNKHQITFRTLTRI